MATARTQLREAAQTWVLSALEALRNNHVIPRPPYDPNVRTGVNLDAQLIVGTDSYNDLKERIELLAPRFRLTPQSSIRGDSEIFYTGSLIEACATRVNRLGTAMQDQHPELDDLIEEFVESVLTDKVDVVCGRVVGHLTSSTTEVITLDEVDLIPIVGDSASTDLKLYETLRDLIPACGRADGHEPHNTFGSEPISLMVTRANVDTGYLFESSNNPATMRQRVDDVLLAIDLLFGGTTHSNFDLVGASREVSGISTTRMMFLTGPVSPLWYQRPVCITSADKAAILAVRALVAAIAVQPTQQIMPPMHYALRRFVGAKFEPTLWDGIVSLVIALEASLLPDNPHKDIKSTLAQRCAALLSTDRDAADAIANDITILYRLRSKLTHGGLLDESKILTQLRNISKVNENLPNWSIIPHATDRLRDLTRRALLCRMVLASGDEPPWSFETGRKADATRSAFDSPAKLTQWRNHWQTWGVENGVPWATDAVAPLVAWRS